MHRPLHFIFMIKELNMEDKYIKFQTCREQSTVRWNVRKSLGTKFGDR